MIGCPAKNKMMGLDLVTLTQDIGPRWSVIGDLAISDRRFGDSDDWSLDRVG